MPVKVISCIIWTVYWGTLKNELCKLLGINKYDGKF